MVGSVTITTGAEALEFLGGLCVTVLEVDHAGLGDLPTAGRRLLRHHELVLEAAVELTDGLRRRLGARFDAGEVHVGAALHDAGKLLAPAELRAGGCRHEELGRRLLMDHGVPEHLARFCVSHGDWSRAGLATEDLLVALADKLWKGERVAALEDEVIARFTAQLDRPRWQVFDVADGVFEAVARGGDDRLARS